MAYQILAIVIIAAIYFTLKIFNSTDTPKIKGIPQIPGVPIFGNLLQLGQDHARVAQKWAAKYGPVFQTRLGNRITHQSALISRPTFYTFHSVVSTSQGFTIGTSPWDESCRRRRKAIGTALNRLAVQSYMPILDLESVVTIKELFEACENGTQDIDPRPFIAQFALNTTLTLNYGYRIDNKTDSKLFKEITHVEREIVNLRSTSNNWQDYIPILRLISAKSAKAEEYRLRRDKYLGDMLENLQRQIASGTDKPCITGNILKDPEAKLNEIELKSICLTMVAASLDTLPSNLVMGIAYLSTTAGQATQAKALVAIEEAYPNGDAWEKCLIEEKVPYITALVKETLRFWTVVPIGLPRSNIYDIPYKGAIFPAGTTFFMNAYAADYDESRFKLPYQFIPERYLGEDTQVGLPHYTFGAGSRICTGMHLSNREIYMAYIRLITSFEIWPAQDPAFTPIINAIGCNETPTSLTTNPKPFKVCLKPRNKASLRQWIAAAEERTKHLL